MKLLTTCADDAEAAVVQSLLEAEGIVCHVTDRRVEVHGMREVRIFVNEGNHATAAQIIAGFRQEHVPEPHPLEGYPFIGIAAFVALLFMSGEIILDIILVGGQMEAGYAGFWTLNIARKIFAGALLALVMGCFLGCLIAGLGAMSKLAWIAVRRRLKNSLTD